MVPPNGSGYVSAEDDDGNVLLVVIAAKGKAAQELWELYRAWDDEEKW